MPTSCVSLSCVKLASLLVLLFALANQSLADERLTLLHSATTMRCTFSVGSSADSRDGYLKPSIQDSKMSFVLDSIDLRGAKARAIGSQGASNEIALETASGITFIEKTDTGNQVFTTVFAGASKIPSVFHAVTSRHMEMMGVVVVSQWYGVCEILPGQ